MRKALILSNILTLAILIAMAFHYKLPGKALKKFFPNASFQKADTANLNCTYPFKYFDFHYKQESDTPRIVMLGNSIIRSGEWNQLLNRKDVINRGIAGDVLVCICDRLKYLKDKKAKIWFIEGGINDLPGTPPESMLEYYKTIVEFVRKEQAIPVINLVIYLSPRAGDKFESRKDYMKINSLITELNSLLVQYATKNNIDYIDLNKVVADKVPALKSEYTTDGVHLTELAYKEWSGLISNVLMKYNL